MSQRKTLSELLSATPQGLWRATGWDDLAVGLSELAAAQPEPAEQASRESEDQAQRSSPHHPT